MIQANLDPYILDRIFNTPITFQNPPAAESMMSGIMSPIMSALGGKKKPGEAGAEGPQKQSMLSGAAGPASPAGAPAVPAPASTSQPTGFSRSGWGQPSDSEQQQPSYLNDFLGMMRQFF